MLFYCSIATIRKRTVRTVAKVALLALVFSVPKFLEVESWGDDVQVTNLRRHPSYSVFAMWTISIFTGRQRFLTSISFDSNLSVRKIHT